VRPGAPTNKTDGGSVQFTLHGAKFGILGDVLDRDPLVWMRLVDLGVQLKETYNIPLSVSDPDSRQVS
jgi:hypothetical protein